MTGRPLKVLFLCTGNSARSILAESILRRDGEGRFQSFSAGSKPSGVVHPLALEVLAHAGYPVEGFRSKSWQEFFAPGAAAMDFILTVCDRAAGEVCPTWPGRPVTAHWGIADPASVRGGAALQKQAFATAFKLMKTRVSLFTALHVSDLALAALTAKVREIGTVEGSSPGQPGIGSPAPSRGPARDRGCVRPPVPAR